MNSGAPDRSPKSTTTATTETEGWRVDLLKRVPLLGWLVRRRWFQFAVVLPNLLFFLFFLVAGIWGSPVGNRNIIIIFVWILWWFLLISVLVPFLSRIWCLVCPFPFFGEWMQRGALIHPLLPRPGTGDKKVGRNRYFGLNRRWPKSLSNIWLQNIGFLGMCTFSGLLLTRPTVSFVALGGLFVIATILHLIYRQRAFCCYICPVGGFQGLYAMTSMLELRSVDALVCQKCKDKGCLAGGETGWGCPWFMYPSKMDRNNYCGLCMECIKTCPHDNITLRARPFCAETQLKGYDEAWKAFIMLALAAAYSVIYLGPYGVLKDWVNVTESHDWLGFTVYALGLWGLALVVFPGIHALGVLLGMRIAGQPAPAWREAFLGMAFPWVPLGLFAWVAFSVPLLFVNGSYILVVLSDPLGWGWDLFGTADTPWSPIVPHWMPYVQVPLLALGLIVAISKGHDRARKLYDDPKAAIRFLAPSAIFLAAVVLLLLRLFVG